MGHVPFEPVKSGLFYSLRLGGIWVAADYWIHYFNARSCTHTVRLENIEEDSNRYVLPLLPKGTEKLQFPRQNANQYVLVGILAWELQLFCSFWQKR